MQQKVMTAQPLASLVDGHKTGGIPHTHTAIV
jgi:hypothetical protein